MSDARKRKKQFYRNIAKRRRTEELRAGLKGFIITCNQRETNAVAEGYRLLNEYADLQFGPEASTESNKSDDEQDDLSVEEALKKEVQNIKDAAKTERRFQSIQNKANNVVFVKTTLDDPTKFAASIYEDILTKQIRKTRFCLRFLPVVSTCYAKLDEITKHAKSLIEEVFHKADEPFTFHIMWKTRCNNTLKRDIVFPKLLELINLVDKGHKTDYDNPDVVLNLDIIGNVCCFGVLRNYYKYKKYNLDQLIPIQIEDKETISKEEEAEESSKTNQTEKDEVELPSTVQDKDVNVQAKDETKVISEEVSKEIEESKDNTVTEE